MGSSFFEPKTPATDARCHHCPGGLRWIGVADVQALRQLAYRRILAATKSAIEERGTFDLVLLGLGEDVHTASLFPGREWGIEADAPDTLAVFNAPKPPQERVSLGARRLSRTRKALFLVAGQPKRSAVAQWCAGEAIPARAICPEAGVDVLVESILLPVGNILDGPATSESSL